MIGSALAENLTGSTAPLTNSFSACGAISALPTARLTLISVTTLETVPLVS
jgi:hypothetical protein